MFNFFSSDKKESLNKGLEKTKESFFSKLGKAIVGKSTVDGDVLDNLEEILISSDVGITTTLKIIDRIQQVNYFLARVSFTSSAGTISSLKE